MYKNSSNGLLFAGIGIIAAGLILFVYSISSYAEIRGLDNRINFDELDNNISMPTSEKYYKHLEISDILNQMLKKNKNLIIKNTSCAYLDYAQHNTISLYKLIYKGVNKDDTRKDTVEENVKYLYEMLDDYKTCKQTSKYKKELKIILEEIEKSEIDTNNFDMDRFINKDSEYFYNTNTEEYESEINPDVVSPYLEEN